MEILVSLLFSGVLVASIGLTAFILWSQRCNEKTYATSVAILDEIRDLNVSAEEKMIYLRDKSLVSYEDHLRALRSFRDPRDLYSPRIRALRAWEEAR